MSKDEPLALNEYRYGMCRQVYTKARSDEEAMQETQQYWPDTTQEELAVVCDDCWQKIHPERNPDEYADSLLQEMLDMISRTSGYNFPIKHESRYDLPPPFLPGYSLLPLKKDEPL